MLLAKFMSKLLYRRRAFNITAAQRLACLSMESAFSAASGVVGDISEAVAQVSFNRHQCTFLLEVCSKVVESCKEICNGEQVSSLVLKELFDTLHKALELVRSCGDENWLWAAALRLNNTRAFAYICCDLYKCTMLVSNAINIDLNKAERISHALRKIENTNGILSDTLDVLGRFAEQDKNELLFNVEQIDQSDGRHDMAHYLLQKLKASGGMTLPRMNADLVLEEQIGFRESRRKVFRTKLWGQPVAVKVFEKGDSTFSKEERVTKQLAHSDPHFVQVIGYSETDEVTYLVMEIAPMDLHKLILNKLNLNNEENRSESKEKTLQEKIDIMLQIATGMKYLHELDIAHRDLKPSNVLVDSMRNGNIVLKLTDFGCSRTGFISYSSSLTLNSGTEMFMAPEMMLRKPYSREVDVYSFATTCYQILTGDVRLSFLVPSKDWQVVLNCPEELCSMIRKCWNISPKERPSFEAICRELWTIKEKLLLGHSNGVESAIQPPIFQTDPGSMLDDEDPRCHIDELKARASHRLCEILEATGEAEINAAQCKLLSKACSQLNTYIQKSRSLQPQLFEELVCILTKALFPIQACGKGWLQRNVIREEEFRSIIEEINSLIQSVSDAAIAQTTLMPVNMNDLTHCVEKDLKATEKTLEGVVSSCQKDMLEIAVFHMSQLQRRNQLSSQQESSCLSFIDPSQIGFQEVIGQGAFGSVFKATWLGKSVAVKMFSGVYSLDRELQALATLSPHPNVVQVLGCSKKEGTDTRMLVMELMEMDLWHLIRRTTKDTEGTQFPLGMRLSVDIMLQIAKGLKYLHQNNIVHRDVKPANILVQFDESVNRITVKITDFGTVRVGFQSNNPDLTAPVGTVKYMAPDVLKEAPYTRKVDVYSFGITCFEIVSGVGAFQPKRRLEHLKALVDGTRPTLPTVCPSELKAIIERCWSSKAEEVPTFADICDSLQKFKANFVILSTPQPHTERGEAPAASSIDKDPEHLMPRPHRERLPVPSTSGIDGNADVQITGSPTVGSTLAVRGSLIKRPGTTCVYRWMRCHMDGTKEAMDPVIITSENQVLEYRLNADDVGTRISLIRMDLDEGFQNTMRNEHINSHWIKCSEEVGKKIEMSWKKGKAVFDAEFHEERRKGLLIIRHSGFILRWYEYFVFPKEAKGEFSSASTISLSKQDDKCCKLTWDARNEWKVRFPDPSARDVAVLTFRHFLQQHPPCS